MPNTDSTGTVPIKPGDKSIRADLREAKRLFALHQHLDAQRLFEKLKRIESILSIQDQYDIYWHLGEIAFFKSQTETSLRLALRTVQLSETLGVQAQAEAHYQAGRGYGEMNAQKLSLEHMMLAQELAPEPSPKIINGLVNSYERMGRLDEAYRMGTACIIQLQSQTDYRLECVVHFNRVVAMVRGGCNSLIIN